MRTIATFVFSTVILVGVGCGETSSGGDEDPGSGGRVGAGGASGTGGASAEARVLKCPNEEEIELPQGVCSWAVCGDDQSGIGVKTGSCQGKFGVPYAILSGDSPGFYVIDTEGFGSEFQALVNFHSPLMPVATTSEEKVAECETGITTQPGALPGAILDISFRGPEACETSPNTCETRRVGLGRFGSVTTDGCNPNLDYALSVEEVGTNPEGEVHEVTMTIVGQGPVELRQSPVSNPEVAGEATFMLQLTNLPDDRRFVPSEACDPSSSVSYIPLFDVSNIRLAAADNGCNITTEALEGSFRFNIIGSFVQIAHTPEDPQLAAVSTVSERYVTCESDSAFVLGGGEESLGNCNVGVRNEFRLALEDPTVALQDNRTLEVTWTHEEREEDEFGLEPLGDLQCPGVWRAPLPCTTVVRFTLAQRP